MPRGHVWSQVAHKTPRDQKGYTPLDDNLGEKCGSKGRFGEPRNPENYSKTDLLPLDGGLGPPKMTSGSSPGNNVKNNGIFDLKMRGLGHGKYVKTV